jgi:uracil-DNA glycosylase
MTMDLWQHLPAAWRDAMKPYVNGDDMARLAAFVNSEYASATVYPPKDDLFSAFRLCAPSDVRVLILGQDPYHKPGQAHGLSFSVRPGVPLPPSLRQVYKEMRDELGVAPTNGDLTQWAKQGVLLLNAVLTVREGKPASHANQGWERFTDAAIRAVNDQPNRVVYLLWGAYAKAKTTLVTNRNHVVVPAGHPSPMNPRGFLGTRPFSQANAALAEAGFSPINWA